MKRFFARFVSLLILSSVWHVSAATLADEDVSAEESAQDAEAPSISMPSVLTKIDLTTIDPLALCNDGTPAVYYWQRSSNPYNAKWLVYLEAGGHCYDRESCDQRLARQPTLMSSKTYSDEREFTGVLDDNFELTPLADANKAYLPYCSSDSHMGDAGPTDHLPWQFRGQRIVRAVIEHLRKHQGLGNALNEHE